ncbi:hypothetical protein AB0F96_09345 [Streptomyces sp. NPDC023998]|uniref:hypothetical protein n=1 Tax=Streptomyces sp. NPDC023998 TaxID=3154597 RepID=UPI0033FFE17D
MTAHVRDHRFIELMAMIAYCHCGGHQLDLEHSMPIGEPWCRQGRSGAQPDFSAK